MAEQVLCARTLLSILVVFYPLTGWTADPGTVAEALRRQEAWHSLGWRRLLHFPGQAGGASRIDSPGFFLAPSGNLDPEAEGLATLAALFEDRPDAPAVACRYPARFRYLAELLAKEEISLPVPVCPDLDHWMANLQPRGVSLVFPEAYLNNPPSMFGHSLLRIESSRYGNPLLAPTIGFAAQTDEERGMGYAFKGIFGGYQGRFSMGWYGDMVRRYGAIENRDIWEYGLDLTSDETEFLLYHFWELRQAEFAYYFLDENCSLQLLSLLEVVRPEADLTESFPLWVIPTDTLRLVERQGLVRSIAYRPSRLTVLRYREQTLPSELVDQVKRFCRDDGAFLPPTQRLDRERRAAVLELATDCLLYRQVSEQGDEDPEAPELGLLLDERNRLGYPSTEPEIVAPSVRPEQGHGTGRLQLRAGVDDGASFIGIGYRTALHDLEDPARGYERGGQVQILQPWLRFYPAREQLRLEAFDIVDILSVPSRTALVRPVAWQGRLGFSRMGFPGAGRRLTLQAEAGFGVAGLSRGGLQSFLLGNARLVVSNHFNGGVDIGPGIVSGVNWQDASGWLLSLQAELRQYLVDSSHASYVLRCRVGREISPGSTLFVEARQDRDLSEARDTLLAGWSCYF